MAEPEGSQWRSPTADQPEEPQADPLEEGEQALRGVAAAPPRGGSFAEEAPEMPPHREAAPSSKGLVVDVVTPPQRTNTVDDVLPRQLERRAVTSTANEESERQTWSRSQDLLDEARTYFESELPASARVGTAPRKAVMAGKGVELLPEPEPELSLSQSMSTRWRSAGQAIIQSTRLRALAQARPTTPPIAEDGGDDEDGAPADEPDGTGDLPDGGAERMERPSTETADSLPTAVGFRGLGVLQAARIRASASFCDEDEGSSPPAPVVEVEKPLHVPPRAPWEMQQKAIAVVAAEEGGEGDDAPPPWAVAAGRAQARGVNFRDTLDDGVEQLDLPAAPFLREWSKGDAPAGTPPVGSKRTSTSTDPQPSRRISDCWDPSRQISGVVRTRGISVSSVSVSEEPRSQKGDPEIDDLDDVPGGNAIISSRSSVLGSSKERIHGTIMDRMAARRSSQTSSDSHNSEQMMPKSESSSSDDEDEWSAAKHEERHKGRVRLTPMQRALIQRRVEDQLGICETRAEESQVVRLQRALGILQLRSFIMVTKQVVDEEPPKWPAVRTLVRSIRFEAVIGVLIIINGFLIGADTMYKKGEERPAILGAMEHVFTVIFLCEFILRLLAFSWVWVFTPMNAFDTFLILVTGVLVNWVLGPIGVDAEMLQRLAAFRVLRLGRLCRAVRMMPMFHELWMLVQGVMECMSLLFWAAIIISVIHYMFGVAVVEIVAKSDTFADDETVQEMFGDLQKAMYTLFQIMTFDSWASIVRPIIFEMPETIPVFLLFVGIAGFVLFNLMTAIVVKNAFDAASQDEEAVAQMKENDRRRQEQALLEMFDELDKDDSGMLTKQEFAESVLDDMVFIHQLKTLDIELEELPDVFDILDDGDGQVSTEEFCTGLMRMQGNAMSRDMLKATKRAKTVNGHFEVVNSEVEGIAHDVLGRIEESLDDSHNNFVEIQAMCAEVLKSLDLIGLRRAIKGVSNVLPTMEEPDDGAEETLAEQRAKDERIAQRAALVKSNPEAFMKPLPAAWIQRRKEKQESRAKTMARKTLTVDMSEDRNKVHGTPCVAQEFQKQWEDMAVWKPEMTFSETLRDEASRICASPSPEGNAFARGVRNLPAYLVDKRTPRAEEQPPSPQPEASERQAATVWRRERPPAGGATTPPDHPHAVPQAPSSFF